MTQASSPTSRNKPLPNTAETKGLQAQPSLVSAGHGDLYNTSAVAQRRTKSEGKSSVVPRSSNQITRARRNLVTNRVPSQNMYNLSASPIIYKQHLVPKIQQQVPLQCTFSPQMWASPPQMQSRTHKPYGGHTMIQQSQRMPQQAMVNRTPVSSSAIFSGRFMMQSGMPNSLHDSNGLPVSTAVFPAQQSTMKWVDPKSQGGPREKLPEMSSFVNDLTTPRGVFSTSAVSTPLLSYISPPGYVHSPSNIGTPLLLCTPPSSYAPAQINNGLPSVGASMDMPPRLELYNQSLKSISYPTLASCNIHLAPVPSLPISYPCTKLDNTRLDAELAIQPPNQTFTTVATSPQNIANVQEGDQSKNIWEDEDLWDATLEYLEWNRDRGSNLFITWKGRKSNLAAKLRQQKLEVRHCFPTKNANLFNVVFEDHKNARKAFTSQHEIRLRMIPPRKSTRNWFRSPSPKFLVKYETKFRLTIRSGKASSHDIVGEFLMSNFEEKKGCYLWADQLKGHRIRVVGALGNLQLPEGSVIYVNSPPNRHGGNKSMGWVSYRSKHTREDFVIRRSGNILREYIYKP